MSSSSFYKLTGPQREQLRGYLNSRFSLGELKDIVFELGYDYENLAGSNKPEFIRELIEYCQRENALVQLINKTDNNRPDAQIVQLAKQIEAGQPAPSQLEPAKKGGDTLHMPGAQGVVTNPSGPIYMTFGSAPQVDLSQATNNLQPKGDITMGDTFNMSGNFQGAIVNIKSTLTNTTQTVGAIPNAQPADKDELKALIEQLSTALQQVPAEKATEAEKVAKRADELVKEAADKDTDQEAVEAKGNLLLKAAQNVAGAMPAIMPIATQIVTHLSKMFGG